MVIFDHKGLSIFIQDLPAPPAPMEIGDLDTFRTFMP